MSTKINLSKQILLQQLVEYRLLSTNQISLLLNSNSRNVRRIMQYFFENDFVEKFERSFSGTSGRPQTVFSMNKNGIKYCKENNLINPSIPVENILWENRHSFDHQLDQNWVLIHAKTIERYCPLKVIHISHTSPYHPVSENGYPFIHDFVPLQEDISEQTGFTPDAVITITKTDEEKTLLFFLELDRSTEPLSGTSPNTIKRKILNYQNYFRYGCYKRYEKHLSCKLQGFRLLFVVNTTNRHGKICRLVRELSPTDFIWVTTLRDIQTQGMGAKIWSRGGHNEHSLESILGETFAFSLCQKTG